MMRKNEAAPESQAPQEGGLFGKLILSLFSIMLSFFILESAARLLQNEAVDGYERQLMFLSGGPILENIGSSYRYRPNSRFDNETLYLASRDPVRFGFEFRYQVTTNNFGLVQKKDIERERPSILILGDSFTEGIGATPWFYDLEKNAPSWSKGYQLINGGMFAFGIEHFRHLYDRLKKHAKIEKLVVIFIADDWLRPLMNWPSDLLECVAAWQTCDGSEGLYSLPPEQEKKQDYIRLIAEGMIGRRKTMRDYLHMSALFQTLNRLRRNYFGVAVMKRSNAIAAGFVAEFGRDNVLFIHLPHKGEVKFRPRGLSKKIQTFLRARNYHLVDGLGTCGLNITDFHKHNSHPNAEGYRKIRLCVKSAILEKLL